MCLGRAICYGAIVERLWPYLKAGFLGVLFSWSNLNLKCWFLWREENWRISRRTRRTREKPTTNSNHMWQRTRIECGTLWWEMSALTTAPSLLPRKPKAKHTMDPERKVFRSVVKSNLNFTYRWQWNQCLGREHKSSFRCGGVIWDLPEVGLPDPLSRGPLLVWHLGKCINRYSEKSSANRWLGVQIKVSVPLGSIVKLHIYNMYKQGLS